MQTGAQYGVWIMAAGGSPPGVGWGHDREAMALDLVRSHGLTLTGLAVTDRAASSTAGPPADFLYYQFKVREVASADPELVCRIALEVTEAIADIEVLPAVADGGPENYGHGSAVVLYAGPGVAVPSPLQVIGGPRGCCLICGELNGHQVGCPRSTRSPEIHDA